MSAWESVPTENDRDWLAMSATEREEYLADVYDEVNGWNDERRAHDRNGYYARDAGSPECIALGHTEDDFDDYETHPSGWDGDPLCLATRWGSCCTECEGECSREESPNLWRLPGVFKEASA